MTKKDLENLRKKARTQIVSDKLSTERSQGTALYADLVENDPDFEKAVRLERFKQVWADLKKNDPGFQQQELAEKLGYSPATVSQFMTGSRKINADFAAAVNKHYPQYPLEWLLGLSRYANEEEMTKDDPFGFSLHDDWTIGFIKAVTGVDFRHGRPCCFPGGKDETVYTINGNFYSLSFKEVRDLLEEVRAFVKFKIDYISKTRENHPEEDVQLYEISPLDALHSLAFI